MKKERVSKGHGENYNIISESSVVWRREKNCVSNTIEKKVWTGTKGKRKNKWTLEGKKKQSSTVGNWQLVTRQLKNETKNRLKVKQIRECNKRRRTLMTIGALGGGKKMWNKRKEKKE